MKFTVVARSLGVAAALVVLAAVAEPPPSSASSPSDGTHLAAPQSGSTEDLHEAPEPARPDAPPEAELSPPPEAEKDQSAPGYVSIANPAFPSREKIEAPEVVDLGRAFEPKDLAPYFATGKLADARAAFDKGHFAETRALLKDADDALPVRYLRALAAVRAEDWKSAAEEMSALADDYPAMRDRCLTHAGGAYEQLQQYDRAAELLAKVSEDSRTWPDARLALFRSLRNAGRLDEAVEAIQPLVKLPAPSWGRDVGAEALIALADLEHARKHKDAEREALLALWGLHPLSALTKQAESRIDTKKIPIERWVDRAETLIEAHRNRQGIDLLKPLLSKLKLPDALACRAHFDYGKALRKEREHRDAIKVLTPVVEKCDDPDLRPRALYVLGSSRSIVDVEHGAATYETLAHDYPAHTFADDALYYAADIELANGKVDEALAHLSEIGEHYPDGDFAGDGLFKSFWIRRQRGETKEAMALLDRIETIFAKAPESYEVERAQYWRARMYEKAGDKEKAIAVLTKLSNEHPATYYGLIARKRVAKLDESKALACQKGLVFPPAGNPWPMHAGPLGDDPHFRAGIELLRMGFNEAVSSELLAANRTEAPSESLRLLVKLLSLSGDERSAHAVARTSLRGDLSGRITAENRPVWEVAYPQAFRDEIQTYTHEAGIEADLLQALMREESALDPKALSWAGAIGLTQLMPYTAKAVGRRIGIKHLTIAKLLEPELNIRIGAAYLGELVKRFDGVYEYALAGYNAGGGAVSKWRRERPELELDEWVEEIPIAETRGYVKRVLRSYNTYSLLYPSHANEVSVAGPK